MVVEAVYVYGYDVLSLAEPGGALSNFIIINRLSNKYCSNYNTAILFKIYGRNCCGSGLIRSG